MSESVEKSEVREGYKEVQLSPKTVRIPEKWEVVKTNSVSEKITDGTHNSPNTVDEGYPYITSKNVRENGFRLDDIGYISKEDHKKIYSRCDPQPGDVLYVKDGANTGIARKNTLDFEFSLLSSVAQIRTDQERLDPDFLTHHLNWPLFKKVMQSKMSGTGITRLTVTKIKNSEILLPPILEQRYIADILSTVDKQIQQTDEMIEKTEELKQGLMQDLITGGIDHSSYKPAQLGPKEVDIPDTWEVERMNDVAEIVSGGTPKKSTGEYWGGNIVWVTPTDVTGTAGMYISDSAEKITQEGLDNTSTYLLEPGAVLMTSRATIGEAVINTVPATTNQGFKSLVPEDRMHNEYLYYYVRTIANYLTEIGGGSTFPEINKTDTENVRVPVPPLDEQKRIANVINQAYKKRLEEQEYKQRLQELKHGLMQDLLTGKVRVNTD
ncbi:type I site-specific deoxyribonuclease subunit RmeS (plasmid) [Haloferax gibbonsii]|uniref:Type I site-specific deoxyribonuclease subunit RmeS n=1 Tax=Haloferax gibbonsii TaxID=35746 RepID=A0A871BN62_HALGI|nr:restriction endonuclease subunit S [Haloferax gibbonsii]QOS14124.1 type I site-specific deoxyribonuclease subunit RmeS [Haloferax gibbonsii]